MNMIGTSQTDDITPDKPLNWLAIPDLLNNLLDLL
jgi:hypothetical protein